MKILMLTDYFYPHIGGVEKHVKYISEELSKRQHQITILTRRYDLSLPTKEEYPSYTVLRFNDDQLLSKSVWLSKHEEIIANSDLIHCHDYGTFIYWYLPFRLKYLNKPVYVTFHGYEGFPINEYTIYYRKITQEFTLGNICVGEYICKWYGTKADYVTYGAVNVNRYNTTTADPLMAVFVGRLEKDTGIMAYLEGLNILKDKFHTKLFLNICGDGSLRKTIEEYVQTNNLSVNLLGFVENPELYIRQSEYVFTSGYLGILEAMANQKIVVSVYENALKKDYLKCFPDADKLMEICDSPHELASKLNHMINNPHIKNIKTSAAFNFAAEQTWNRLADIYESLYTRTGAGQYGK